MHRVLETGHLVTGSDIQFCHLLAVCDERTPRTVFLPGWFCDRAGQSTLRGSGTLFAFAGVAGEFWRTHEDCCRS